MTAHPPEPGAAVIRSSPSLSTRSTERLGDRLATSALILWATAFLLRVFQFATMAILARVLSPSDYGVVAIATVVVWALDILTNIQVGSVILRTQTLTKAHLDTAFTLNLLRGLLSAGGLLLLAHPVAHFMNDPRLTGILCALAIPALAGSVHNPHFLIYARNLDFRYDSRRDAAAGFLGSIAAIAIAFALHSYWALIAGSVINNITWTIFTYWRVPGRPGFSLRQTREMITFGGWMVVINMLDFINSRVDYVLIGKGVGSAALGAYHIGQQITTIAIGDIVIPLGKALFPAFSLLANDLPRLRASYRQVQSITLAIALPFGFGISALALNIVLLLFGRKWDLAVPVITFIAPLFALQAMTASIESLAFSTNNTARLFWRTLVNFLFGTAVMTAGYFLGGFIGVVYGRTMSGLVSLVYSMALAASITQGSMFDPIKASWRSFTSVGAMWVVLMALPQTLPHHVGPLAIALLLKVLAGAMIYLGMHLLLWRLCGMPEEAEFHLIRQISRLVVKLFESRTKQYL
jgi:PST family polysaccharide transporter